MQYLTTEELAKRWAVAPNTLRRWRVDGTGPGFVKLGTGIRSAVRYRIDDIEEYEKDNYFSKQ